jgi:protein-tyrosine phosphatase
VTPTCATSAVRGWATAVLLTLLGVPQNTIVQDSYLPAGFAQVTASYGSMYGYTVHGLGLRPQTIAKLRHKLLVG